MRNLVVEGAAAAVTVIAGVGGPGAPQAQQRQELEELSVLQNRLPNRQHQFPIVGSLIQVRSAMLEGQQ